MKKIVSLALVGVMALSMVPTAMAGLAEDWLPDDTNDYTAGTKVEYVGQGSESYTITVPAQLAPGDSGDVIAAATIPSNRRLTVETPYYVTLKNSINKDDKKDLTIYFDGIELIGSNTESLSKTESVSIADINGALFGVWSGHFDYRVVVMDYKELQTAPDYPEYEIPVDTTLFDVVAAANNSGMNSLNIQTLSNFLVSNEDEFTSADFNSMIQFFNMMGEAIFADYAYTYCNKTPDQLTEEERYIVWNALPFEAKDALFAGLINLGNAHRFMVSFDTDAEGYPVLYYTMRH